MIVDLHEIDRIPGEGPAGVAICGAGVAGISLALELADRYPVLLLDGGGMQPSADSQALYAGRSAGRDYFDLRATRLRCLGGSSNHWAGWCRPLDAHDFAARAHHRFSGWPIGRQDLDPYLDRACEILDIPATDRVRPPEDELTVGLGAPGTLDPIRFWWSKPTRFARKYEQAIREHPNITCLLHANLIDIRLTDDGRAVDSFQVSDYRDRRFRIDASRFVLAAGGIENPRLLLACNSQASDGIGNANGLVGRFFAEHLHNGVGDIILRGDVWERIVADWSGFRSAMRFFAPSLALIESEQILNFGLRFEPSRTSAAGGMRAVAKDLICRASLTDVVERISGDDLSCFDATLRIASEQALNPDSRIRLDVETDRFGMPRTVVDWRLSPLDKATMRVAALRFGQALAAADLGRLRVPEWLLDDDAEIPGLGEAETAGHHHMCTTRMAASPDQGVVDSRQRVFGIDNLYVAGSSVFSTAGHANPTLTIVQMTLRLADVLKG